MPGDLSVMIKMMMVIEFLNILKQTCRLFQNLRTSWTSSTVCRIEMNTVNVKLRFGGSVLSPKRSFTLTILNTTEDAERSQHE